MQFRFVRGALAATVAALALGGALLPAKADMFDVKGVEITKGESEITFAVAPQSGFPVNSDFVRLHGEVGYGYGLTSWLKVGGKLGIELGASGTDDVSYGGIETQIMLLDPSTARIGLGWFTGLDVGFVRDFGQILTFGPLVSLEVTKQLTVTINPLFQKFWDPTTPGLDLNYAWQVKNQINDSVAIGVEGYGTVPDISNAPSIEFQEHRVGPVLYLSGDIGGRSDGMKLGVGGDAKAGEAKAGAIELQLGVLFGMTDATPDTTGRAKLAITW